ncbi:unnamed protein product [Cochlearia groenlandica]
MERGDESKQVLDLNTPIDAMTLRRIPPTFVQALGGTHFRLIPAREEHTTTLDGPNHHDGSSPEPTWINRKCVSPSV